MRRPTLTYVQVVVRFATMVGWEEGAAPASGNSSKSNKKVGTLKEREVAVVCRVVAVYNER